MIKVTREELDLIKGFDQEAELGRGNAAVDHLAARGLLERIKPKDYPEDLFVAVNEKVYERRAALCKYRITARGRRVQSGYHRIID